MIVFKIIISDLGFLDFLVKFEIFTHVSIFNQGHWAHVSVFARPWTD